MQTCPYCAEEIQEEAVKCRFCGEWLKEQEAPEAPVLRSVAAGHA